MVAVLKHLYIQLCDNKMRGKTLRARFKMLNSFYLQRDTLINIEMHENVVVVVRCLVGGEKSHQGRWRLSESSGSSHKDPTFVNVVFFPAPPETTSVWVFMKVVNLMSLLSVYTHTHTHSGCDLKALLKAKPASPSLSSCVLLSRRPLQSCQEND